LRCAAFAVSLLCAGCPDPAACRQPFAGDPAKAVEAELILDAPSDGGASLLVVSDGDRVVLQPPPQGGFVLYAGARLRNVDPCGVTFKGQLRDAMTGAIHSDFDLRRADLEEAGGWWVPKSLASFSTVSNVPACPDATGGGVVDNPDLALEVIATDRGGRTATVMRRVVPVCAPGACEAECRCVCGADYHPGKCGGPDGGLPDGGEMCGR
jgi:hypothetical protein